MTHSPYLIPTHNHRKQLLQPGLSKRLFVKGAAWCAGGYSNGVATSLEVTKETDGTWKQLDIMPPENDIGKQHG